MKEFKQILIQSLVFTLLANIGFAKSESLTIANQTNIWTNNQAELRSILDQSPDVVDRLQSDILLEVYTS